ncbi:PAQR family membrane homeostasis protein TrhA [Candidatus Phytoplasma melaleucae]|uniref:Hemolysin III family protein n=1 Tax=Candidatus Phytoplasma melaleucae TaxID=2982630 RepID=A0ABT9DDD6_9MOLU|nr:hemolysin III family protein ['Melaleuca sp.' phytoplasma]MDO8167869.1 hemolysin III family protein ['Melaleuca sp.' phytoplasma]MDV3205483.1 hemolysin III family protein [Weeping tea tree witches'-broom phytoplasma]
MQWPRKKSKTQTTGEEIANAISHGLMIPFSIIIYFIYKRIFLQSKSIPKIYLMLFTGSMLVLYLFSCLYHSLAFAKNKRILNQLDHIGIYLLIWGSFIPFLFLNQKLQHPIWYLKIINWGDFFFIIQTIVVFLGIFFKIFYFKKGNRIHLLLYLILGWSGIFLINTLKYSLAILFLLLLEGVFYSTGVFFYCNSQKKYYHFIWHLFVIMGNICHVYAIYLFINRL